ncbi:MAG: SGNH/GDSL hydrolase family protein, partial [Spirochaetota bacterium]
WLGDVQFIYRWHESYSSSIWEIGEAHNVPVVDIRKAFLEQRNYSHFLCKDGIHPNTEGHRLITSKIIKFAQEHMSV